MNIQKKEYKAYSLKNFREIPQIEKVPEEIKKNVEVTGRVLPFKSNSYVVDELIDWSNIPDDPMFVLTFPVQEMLIDKNFDAVSGLLEKEAPADELKNTVHEIREGLNPHPAGQLLNIPEIDGQPLTGVQHKYKETALFFPGPGQTCHAYCTFCFRWPQFTGFKSFRFAMKESDLLMRYVKENPGITDVLFTGGDPMVMSAQYLAKYIEPFLDPAYENVRTIRIGTKALAYWPYRFLTDEDSDEILRLFEKVTAYGKNLAFMAHFNHPRELTTNAVKEAIKRINSTGALIRTQAPILKNINDSPEVWAEMWRKQVDINCVPYYMFVARDTGANHFFSVPLVRAWEIFREAYSNVSGICRTVRGPSMSCVPGKIQVLGVTEINNEKVIALNMLQGRNPDWTGRPFFAEYDEKAVWIDQLKPAFGEEKFFFEDELEAKYSEHIHEHEHDAFV